MYHLRLNRKHRWQCLRDNKGLKPYAHSWPWARNTTETYWEDFRRDDPRKTVGPKRPSGAKDHDRSGGSFSSSNGARTLGLANRWTSDGDVIGEIELANSAC
jgi:hypothetical protein